MSRAEAATNRVGLRNRCIHENGCTVDRKSTRLNSSHANISYAVFCLKNPTTTEIYTLSLHDALPICFGRPLSPVGGIERHQPLVHICWPEVDLPSDQSNAKYEQGGGSYQPSWTKEPLHP